MVRSLGRYLSALISTGILLLSMTAAAGADADGQPDWLIAEVFKSVVPGAIYAGPIADDPPVATIYGAGKVVGYAFETSAIVDSVGFSGAPFQIIVGLDADGVISGVTVMQHDEPILNYGDIVDRLNAFIGQYPGLDHTGKVRLASGGQTGEIDGISTATISARAFHYAIIQSARIVARSLGFASGDRDTTMVDMLRFEPLSWHDLTAVGAIRSIELSRHEGHGLNEEAPTTVYTALLSPTSIGRNLISRGLHKSFVSAQGPDDLVILIASSGPYSIIGTKVFDTGIFDRLLVRQGERQFALERRGDLYRYVPFLVANDAPSMTEMGIFTVSGEAGIDVLKPWQLVVTVHGAAGSEANSVERALTYALPQRFVLPATPPRTAAEAGSPVQAAWQAQSTNLIVLSVALGVLSLILIFMNALTRRPKAYQIARIGFLSFTLVWIGLLSGAQLSVINPVVWLQALMTGNGIGLFLMDPLLVLLTAFVLLSFFLWGRGVFCGWLCPFGALQELLAVTARRLKLPQISLSHATHRKLWPDKYIALTILVLCAWHAPATLGVAAEVEPFKTVISLKFDRAWPFVIYAVVVLAVGLFIERAFCRFLCPLGAIMAIGGKLRLRDPLKRRDECGSPCQLCSKRCPIQAIAPSGRINMDECFYCLDCQVIYQDEHSCPPLIKIRKRLAEADPLKI